MAISTVSEKSSLDTLSEELVYTETRLLVDDQAKEFAPPMSQLLVRLGEVRTGQVGAKYEEVAAQAAVTAVNDQLDDFIRGLAKELLRVVDDDIRSPRYLRYFSDNLRRSPAWAWKANSRVCAAGSIRCAANPRRRCKSWAPACAR